MGLVVWGLVLGFMGLAKLSIYGYYTQNLLKILTEGGACG